MSDTATTLTYSVDTNHSGIRFWIRHLMISKVHGTISGITGTVTGTKDAPELASIDVTIQLSTFSTNNEGRDGHVKSADFLDVEKFPTITFKSKSVTEIGPNNYEVLGDLTLHGVTKEETLTAEVSDEIKSPMGSLAVGVTASGVINRSDFGIHFNQTLETGGVALGNEIHYEIDLELTRAG
jgi:polyisoprenoid-binding protein YceI